MNPYVFAKVSQDPLVHRFYEAHALLKKYTEKSQLPGYENLRGTAFKQHLATFNAAGNRCNTKDLANFLGHSEEIHKNYYHLRVPLREIVSLPNLLSTALGKKHQELIQILQGRR